MIWKLGRQMTKYKTLTLLNWKVNFFKFYGCDLHLIWYSKSHYIPPHTDPVKFGRHYRINIVLIKSKSGGEFICEKAKRFFWGRILYFRPDVMEHSVTECSDTRFVLSFGWLMLD